MATSFWMVWNEGNRAPTVKHPTPESAEKEAERLARANEGRVFHVLRLVGSCRAVTTVWDRIVEDDPSPF